MFQILDEMNVADGENGTTHLVICDQLIEARTAKGGGHVTVGVPAEVIHWLTFNSENTKAVLLIIDFDEYKRRAVAVSPAPPTDLEYNRDENSPQGKAAIAFYNWMESASMSNAKIPLEIKWRMFADQKNAKK